MDNLGVLKKKKSQNVELLICSNSIGYCSYAAWSVNLYWNLLSLNRQIFNTNIFAQAKAERMMAVLKQKKKVH